eukprot:CAMPEP_0119011528 /NCGR_PEP_ID=MMETSP1176-20130426/5738_1 /TAXON_ID=265551 /ORGANISM="Synedropsis recta cf, Strain CCMP1620" /LENGTH=239 /DNA_ID=CAMNT_0006964375 /DNA_START=129 /DNA_END=848 /DNA_ORIENTATION=+
MRDRLHSLTKSTLGAGGSIHQAVALPKGESCAGWVAAHTVDFFNDLSLIWQVVASDPYLSSFKPGEGYPSGVEYRWSSTTTTSATTTACTTIRVSAPQYVNLVLQWISDQLNDRTLFPDDAHDEQVVYATPAFAALCGQIFRRLFRVYGILYTSFFGTMDALDMAPHLNTCFKHFMYFCVEFGLLPEREVEPLAILVQPVRKQYYALAGIGNGGNGYNTSKRSNNSTRSRCPTTQQSVR